MSIEIIEDFIFLEDCILCLNCLQGVHMSEFENSTVFLLGGIEYKSNTPYNEVQKVLYNYFKKTSQSYLEDYHAEDTCPDTET